MTRQRKIARVEDLQGGEYFRTASGLFRATNWLAHDGDRRCLRLRDDLTEERDGAMWCAPNVAVLEVLVRDAPPVAQGGEVDPLRLGGGR